MFKRVRVHSYEAGLHFYDGEFRGLLPPGTHWLFNPLGKNRVDVVSLREPALLHSKLDLIVKSGQLEGRANVVDLQDDQRALVWIDNRFSNLLAPGLYAFWNSHRDVRIEVVAARHIRFQHAELATIARSREACTLLDMCSVNRNCVGVLFYDGTFTETLAPGQYAFWKNTVAAGIVEVDMREIALDVSGQEIMTADKVTLRLNASVTYRVVDARQVVTATEDVKQSLYREAQLAVRAVVGARQLDQFLNDKDALAKEIDQLIRPRATELGLELASVGIRDVILPGEMKTLMNKVTEAKKAAEANLIARREETAAIRSQANTAKLLEGSPTLMRLRELEVLEKIAADSKMQVVLGEKGLADRVTNLL